MPQGPGSARPVFFICVVLLQNVLQQRFLSPPSTIEKQREQRERREKKTPSEARPVPTVPPPSGGSRPPSEAKRGGAEATRETKKKRKRRKSGVAFFSSHSSCVILCVFPHRAHRAHRAHNAHRAHCPRLPPRKTHGVSRHRRAARVAPPGLKPFCLPSGGSRRCAALHPWLIRGRRFAAFFLPRFARRHFFSIESIESIFSIFRRAKLRLSRRRPRRRAGSRCCPASHRPFRTFTMLESTKGTNEVNDTNRQWQE